MVHIVSGVGANRQELCSIQTPFGGQEVDATPRMRASLS